MIFITYFTYIIILINILHRKQRAPVYYIYDWKELPALLSQVRMLSEDEIYRKRVAIVKWYKRFRLNYSKIFAESVEWKFFKKWRHF